MIPKLNRKKNPLVLMIESKIDPWEIHKSKIQLRRNLGIKEQLFHLEGKRNTILYGTKGVVGTPKNNSPSPVAS